jgi:DNA-binding transcriptional LysR family regulator
MSTRPLPSVEDLLLVIAVADYGSVGMAAAALRVTQASASQRLAVLERRLGVVLFDRGPLGARPTGAGTVLAERARGVLDLLEQAGEAARQADSGQPLRVGTIASLASAVFCAFDRVLDDTVNVVQRTDHGEALVRAVADGVLDAAVVALPAELAGRRGTKRIPLGHDVLAVLVPRGVQAPARSGRRAWLGHQVVLSTYSTDAQLVADRLAVRGASVKVAGTASVAVALARQRGDLAVVPRSATMVDVREGERVQPFAWQARIPLSLVVAREPDKRLEPVRHQLIRALGLRVKDA